MAGGREYLVLREADLAIHVEFDAVAREEASWAAWLVDHPDCIAGGRSKEEAVERLHALAPAYLASCKRAHERPGDGIAQAFADLPPGGGG